MTNATIFFDTDCISAFLWVNNQSLLEKMYPERIKIPQQVYEEIAKPTIPHLKARIDDMVERGVATIVSMDIMSEEFALYHSLIKPEKGHMVIGKGEAASISLAKQYNGILGSNNLKDVAEYVEKFSLQHKTTGDILVEALERQLITEEEGNEIWALMLKRRRKIGASSFTEYLQREKLNE